MRFIKTQKATEWAIKVLNSFREYTGVSVLEAMNCGEEDCEVAIREFFLGILEQKRCGIHLGFNDTWLYDLYIPSDMSFTAIDYEAVTRVAMDEYFEGED